MSDALVRAVTEAAALPPAEADAALARIAAAVPDSPAALNALGLALLRAGRAAEAGNALARAVALDPKAPALWLNLADARRRSGDRAAEVAALDGALALDPYALAPLILKARALAARGEEAGAVATWRALFAAYPDAARLSPEAQAAFAEGRALVDAVAAARAKGLAAATAEARAAADPAERRRIDAYLGHLAGTRRIYAPAPTGGHFPFLPADEYFDRALFPWFAELEAATDAIRAELAARWTDAGDGPAPYVEFPAHVPANQWAELNHSPRWGVFYLIRDGVQQEENRRRCPATAALLDRLPLFDLPGKGPTAMFSILDAHTRIPAHSGSSNVRATVHLPLVLPGRCRFRVGGDTRDWRMGEAWAFDDTIEHEAWNDSDRPRAILIIDAWNPHLSAAEREAVRRSGG